MIFVTESQAQNLINQWLKKYKHMPLSSRLKFPLCNHNSGLNIRAYDNLQDREKKCPVRPSLGQRKEMLCDQRVWSKPLSQMFYRKRIWCPCKIIFQTGADIKMSNADHCWHISLSWCIRHFIRDPIKSVGRKYFLWRFKINFMCWIESYSVPSLSARLLKLYS